MLAGTAVDGIGVGLSVLVGVGIVPKVPVSGLSVGMGGVGVEVWLFACICARTTDGIIARRKSVTIGGHKNAPDRSSLLEFLLFFLFPRSISLKYFPALLDITVGALVRVPLPEQLETGRYWSHCGNALELELSNSFRLSTSALWSASEYICARIL